MYARQILALPLPFLLLPLLFPFPLLFPLPFEEDLCEVDDLEDLKDWDRLPELLLVFDVPLDEEPSLLPLPLPFPFDFFLHPLLSGG